MLALMQNRGLTERATTMDVKDLTPLYKKYKGQWVDLKDDEVSVISHGEKAQAVWQDAVEKGFEKPIMFKVPSKLLPYIG